MTGALRQPVFLVGAERSGTTLLRLMLDHHPRIAWQNEFEFTVDRLPEGGGWPEINEYRRWLSSHRIFLASGLQVREGAGYQEVVRGFLEQRRGDKPIVGATVHRHFDRLLRLWPDARFIHLVRDPRDVARSCIGMGWAGNVWTGVGRWIRAERTWTRLSASLGAGRGTELRYEDLIRAPREQLERLCVFIGVEYDPAMLAYPDHTTYSAPDPSLLEQWKRTLSTRQVRLVESRVGSLLEARGYAPSGVPPRAPGTVQRGLLRAQDRIARVRFSINRWGAGLWAAGVVSRRVGSEAWRRAVQLRMNEVASAHLK